MNSKRIYTEAKRVLSGNTSGLSRYPKYKDSGVEWLGEVPEHWALYPLFSVADERNESNRGMPEDNLLSLSYGRIIQKDIDSNDGLLPESFETYQIVHPGDIVFRLTDLQNDKRSLRTAIVDQRGIITSAYLALAPEKVQPQFINYLLRAYDVTKVFYSMGGGLRQSLKFSDVKRLPILIPQPKEQTDIAAFLDRETEKIDALVEEQERLIELLKEKRQAVISHAVTKGLNLDAQMKESGIDWIGVVPSHWEVLKFTREVRTAGGQVDPKVEPYSSMNLIGPEHVESKTGCLIELATALEQSAESGKYLCLQGYVVYSKIRPALGKVVIAPEDCLCSADMYPFDGIRKVQNQFLFWLLLSAQFVAWSVLEADRVAMPKINRETFRKLHIPVPPHSEQDEIVEFLNSATAEVDNLIAEANRANVLLQERRSALISAAVTGQIDVRNYRPQEAAAVCQ